MKNTRKYQHQPKALNILAGEEDEMDLKEQEKEILEYIWPTIQRDLGYISIIERKAVKLAIQAILRRYDVFPVEDERRE